MQNPIKMPDEISGFLTGFFMVSKNIRLLRSAQSKGNGDSSSL